MGTGRFTCNNKHVLRVLRFPRSITDWFGFGLGWVGEFNALNFSKRLLNEFTDWLLFNYRTQFFIPSSPIVIGGGRGDMYTFSYKTSPVFQSNNFRNTMNWKCFLKNDSARSSLIELQSFLQSKIDVDPIFCVLMSLPCIVQVLCVTWYIQVSISLSL